MMTKTILLDLDNTLLGCDMRDFLPPYFAGLNRLLAPLLQSQDVQPLMVAAVQAVHANQDPDVTNMTVFMAEFCKQGGLEADIVQPILEQFYSQEYPQLRRHSTLRAEAALIVESLLSANYQVIIATNPLFPATAIEQRLAWAEIDHFPYALVTTMENSSFAKPNPRYYEDIMKRTGSRPETTWMVGDDVNNDILPAKRVGCKTWWVTDEAMSTEAQIKPVPDQSGTLTQLLTWIERGGLNQV